MNLQPQSTGEKDLWTKYMALKIEDAMGIFKVPDIKTMPITPSLQDQYEIQLKRLKKKTIVHRGHIYENATQWNQASAGRNFLESSHFDEVASDVGYDSNFVNKIFSFIQEVITLEKKLFNELSVPCKRVACRREKDRELKYKDRRIATFSLQKNERRKIVEVKIKGGTKKKFKQRRILKRRKVLS